MSKKKRTIKILSDKNEIKKAEEFLNDGNQEKWEKGELGKNSRHAVMSKENVSGSPTTIRIPDKLKDSISSLAHSKGLTTNSYIRMILTEHVQQHRKVS